MEEPTAAVAPPVPPPPPSSSAGAISPPATNVPSDSDATKATTAKTTMKMNAAATKAAANAPVPQQKQHQQQQQQGRPSQQRFSELEELRQKGLATLLNKHFTSVITTLSKEKAEADAQLRDLEHRKAHTSDFVESTNNELSPIDATYLQIKKKRNECRRKERETLLLYQRYVHKFGATGVVQVPTTTVPPPVVSSPPPDDFILTRSNSASVLVPTMAQAIDAKVTELKQMGVDPIPTRDRLGVDTTYQTLHARDAMELQLFFRRQLEERGIDARCCAVSPGGTMNPRKLFHGPRFPGGLPQLMESPGSPDSKPISATPWQYAFPGDLASPLYHHTEGDEDNEDDDDDDENNRDAAAAAAAAVKEGGGGGGDRFYYQPQQQYQEYMHDVNGFSGYVVNNNYPMGEDDDDYDDRSMVSGLTSVNSAATMLMHETENRLVQFLKTETEAIRKMLADETGNHSNHHQHNQDDARSIKSGKSAGAGGGTATSVVSSDHNSSTHMSHSDLGSHSSRAADQAEHMVKQMQDILNQFQQEAAARGETVVVATGPDGITTTTTTTTSSATHTPRKIPTSNPNEEWMAYYDETYQKEYYHEVNSNRTQWEMPEGAIPTLAASSLSSSTHTTRSISPGANTEAESECTTTTATASLMTDYGQQQSSLHKTALSISHEDVMPDHHLNVSQRRDMLGTSLNSMSSHGSGGGSGSGGRSMMIMSSRRSLYLKRRRRQRKRRLLAAVLASTVLAGMTLVWKHQYHPHETWPDAAKVMVGGDAVNQVLHMHQMTMRAWSQVVDSFGGNHHKTRSGMEEPTMTIPLELNETVTTSNIPEEVVDTTEDVTMDSNVTTTTADDMDESILVETVIEEEDEDDEVANEAMAVAIVDEEEDTSLVIVPEKIRRPWACNLPLAWLFHPVCWRLAHESPLYCAHTLAMSMMQ